MKSFEQIKQPDVFQQANDIAQSFNIEKIGTSKEDSDFSENFKLSLENLNLDGKITVSVFDPSQYNKLRIKIELFNSKGRISSFSATIMQGNSEGIWATKENKNDVRFLIFNRRIDKEYRRKKIATFNFSLIENLIERINHLYPQYKCKYLEILTTLASDTSLLIDQNWLKQHEMDEYLKPGSHNFGYIPDMGKLDDYTTKLLLNKILQSKAEEREDGEKANNPYFRLIKKL